MTAGARGWLLIAVLALAGWEPFRSPHPDVERGNRAHADGRWDDAVAAYEHARADGADGATIDFDVGTALLGKAATMAAGSARDAVEKTALEALERAGRSSDREVSARAHYNRGNALLGRDRLDDAIAAYKDALRASSDLEDARLNLEQALKRRKKQQSPPSKGQGGGKSPPPPAPTKPDSQPGQGQPGQQEKADPSGSGGQTPPQAPPADAPAPPSARPEPAPGPGSDPTAPPADSAPGTGEPPPATGADGSRRSRPPPSRTEPRSPPSPAERKLDDLERSSRDLRREQIRRRSQDTYRPPTGPDW